MPRRKTKPVYFALPKDRYDCLFYPLVLAAIQERFPAPEWTVIEPARELLDNNEWRARWLSIRDKLQALIVWPRENGTIGRGCKRQIEECETNGTPVLLVNDEGHFFALKEVRPRCLTHPHEKPDWRNYAAVLPGARL